MSWQRGINFSKMPLDGSIQTVDLSIFVAISGSPRLKTLNWLRWCFEQSSEMGLVSCALIMFYFAFHIWLLLFNYGKDELAFLVWGLESIASIASLIQSARLTVLHHRSGGADHRLCIVEWHPFTRVFWPFAGVDWPWHHRGGWSGSNLWSRVHVTSP